MLTVYRGYKEKTGKSNSTEKSSRQVEKIFEIYSNAGKKIMNCPLCSKKPQIVQEYKAIDKYQGLIKDTGWHTWKYCDTCDFYMSENSETPEDRRKIYMKYWQKELRGISIKEHFGVVDLLQYTVNAGRIKWLTEQAPLTKDSKILDIGSGYATFPYMFKRIKQNVKCVEPEPTAAKFINNALKMPCVPHFYEDYETKEKFSLILMCNVLEHFEEPIKMLKKAREQLSEKGSIFIEVPDACEFKELSLDHDDFNSLHLWFFTPTSLKKMLAKAGLAVKGMTKIHYTGMGNVTVTRIGAVCHAAN